jgi:hypothetical protein
MFRNAIPALTFKNMTAQQVVTQQIETYNTRNLEANMALFSDNFQLISLEDGKVVVDGIEACREMYANLFANSPKLFANIVSRIDFNNKVVLHEHITGRNGSDGTLEQLIVFEVNNNKIEKIYRF